MRDRFAVDVAEICTMPRSQQLRMVDACRFLNNNLPAGDVSLEIGELRFQDFRLGGATDFA
jgi:hypothetical protein